MIKVAEPYITEKEVEAVREVILSGRYVSGKKVKEFEDKFAEYIGTKYAVAVNSGTSALHLALIVLGIKQGDEVIVPPLTFFATISAVLYQGAVPVFTDIDLDSYCMDPGDIEEKITKKTKAIIPVHLFGNSVEMDEIMELAKAHNLKVIEDGAQAHGTEYKNRKVGSIGDVSCFSFYATKHITTGEGGILLTNDFEFAKLAKIISNHGMTDRDTHTYLGYNYRMNEITAAMGIVQLERLDELNLKRIQNSQYLIKRLNEINLNWYVTPIIKDYIKHTYFWCPVLILEDKLGMSTKELRQCLVERGMETRQRYQEPLYKQKIILKKFPEYRNIYLTNIEEVVGKLLGLPNHPKLEKRDLDMVIEIFTSFGN